MDRDKVKQRILKRFKKKLTGRIIIPMGKKKLGIEYMYGGKYCLKRKSSKGVSVIEMLGDIDKIVDLIIKEKTRIY